MNLQTLFQFAGLPSDFGRVPRERKAKIEAKMKAVQFAPENKPEDKCGANLPSEMLTRTLPEIEVVEGKWPTLEGTFTAIKPPPKTVRFDVQVTDTFGGEANYSWKEDYVITVPDNATDRSVVIAAKKAAGWAGVKCDTENHGDSYTLRPRGMCQIMFITYKED